MSYPPNMKWAPDGVRAFTLDLGHRCHEAARVTHSPYVSPLVARRLFRELHIPASRTAAEGAACRVRVASLARHLLQPALAAAGNIVISRETSYKRRRSPQLACARYLRRLRRSGRHQHSNQSNQSGNDEAGSRGRRLPLVPPRANARRRPARRARGFIDIIGWSKTQS